MPAATPQDVQSVQQVATEACGFVTIVAGTFLLHTTKDLDVTLSDLNRLTKEKESILAQPLVGRKAALADHDSGLPYSAHAIDVEGPLESSSNGGGGGSLTRKR